MIKKLRRKFIFVNMALVTLVLLIVFGSLVYTNYTRIKNESTSMLFHVLDMRGDSPSKPQIGKRPSENNSQVPGQSQSFLTFYVETDAQGNITKISNDKVSVDEDVVADAVKVAFESKNDTGTVSNYSLRYAKRNIDDGCKIAFIDMQSGHSSIKSLVISSLLIGLCALAAFFVISLFLSDWALRPVEKSWRQQRQFVADASHELKTPLTVILANTGILLSHSENTIETERQWVESTKEEGERMKKLIDDMLFLAKSDAMQTKKIISQFNLSDLLLGYALQFEAVAFENKINIDVLDIEPEISYTGDEGEIKKLCGILLDNACKYAGTGGNVKVSLRRQGEHTEMCVNNTGAPIAPQELSHIFERFYRTDKSRVHTKGGYGLGLAIAKSICDAHKAEISASSDGENGTTFTVTF